MMNKAHGYCFILISLLCFVSAIKCWARTPAIKKLNSIKDLAGTDFGRPFPRHGLLLLYWFANNRHIDVRTLNNNDVITLNFDTGTRAFGIHQYKNYVIPSNNNLPLLPDPGENRYMTLGNLGYKNLAFPEYVTHNYYNSEGLVRNMDRIICRIRPNSNIIDEVYITQHLGERHYDPANTFLVTPNLLRELRRLKLDNPTLEDIIHQIVYCKKGRRKRRTLAASDSLRQIRLTVTPTSNGKARICWTGILDHNNVILLLFPNDNSTTRSTWEYPDKVSGSVNTSIALNGGLQVRLHSTYNSWFFGITKVGDELVRGPEFHDANRQLPVEDSDYKGVKGVSLQLFVKNGKASVRFYIKKTFTDWKKEFYNDWIDIHPSASESDYYKKYQWVINLKKESRSDLADIPDYDVYAYDFGVTIEPGDQVRLRHNYFTWLELNKFKTPTWEGVCDSEKTPLINNQVCH